MVARRRDVDQGCEIRRKIRVARPLIIFNRRIMRTSYDNISRKVHDMVCVQPPYGSRLFIHDVSAVSVHIRSPSPPISCSGATSVTVTTDFTGRRETARPRAHQGQDERHRHGRSKVNFIFGVASGSNNDPISSIRTWAAGSRCRSDRKAYFDWTTPSAI